MDNPEKLATLNTRAHQAPGVNPGAREE